MAGMDAASVAYAYDALIEQVASCADPGAPIRMPRSSAHFPRLAAESRHRPRRMRWRTKNRRSFNRLCCWKSRVEDTREIA